MNWKNFVCSVVCLAGMTCAEAVNYTPENVSASIALKVPGNDAKRYPLTLQQLDIVILNISGWRPINYLW